MSSDLAREAAAYGIISRYKGADGTWVESSDRAIRALLDILAATGPPAERTPGERWPPAPNAPAGCKCQLPAFLRRGRAWGMTCQLYSLRSSRNWGIGDFEDLARLSEIAAAQGADFLGVNPLHSLFLADPSRCSPFSPSHRYFLNPLYIAIDQLEEYDGAEPAELEELRQAALVEYAAVARKKLGALRQIWDARRPETPAGFLEEGGKPLRLHALFEALSIYMVSRGEGAGWHMWPQPFQDPNSEQVRNFSQAHREDMNFYIWLQWVADQQLRRAAERAREAGMRIGLFLDLAVGTSPDGSETWSDRDLTVVGAEIGAPPDLFNPFGQSWGLAATSPRALVERDFRPLRHSYEAILRHAGALRIDHAMSLYRLYWIPDGLSAAEAAYVFSLLGAVLRSLSLDSRETEALIIGEDLGVVPEGFRKAMQDVDVLGYRLFFFERSAQGFLPARRWPASALACVGSHDTATLAGWWTGGDIEVRRSIGLLDEEGLAEQLKWREEERSQAIGLVRQQLRRDLGQTFDGEVAATIHAFVASTPCRLMAVQIEDLLGLQEQPNLPGTVGEHPNWRRRLPVALEDR